MLLHNAIVAGIDPGQTTGVAVSRLENLPANLHVVRCDLQSYKDPVAVAQLVKQHSANYVVLERKARNGSPQGTEPYDHIMVLLGQLGYTEVRHFLFQDQHVMTITPGIWKPVMKQRAIPMTKWQPQDQHQKDAIQLMFYAINLNYMNHVIDYQ